MIPGCVFRKSRRTASGTREGRMGIARPTRGPADVFLMGRNGRISLRLRAPRPAARIHLSSTRCVMRKLRLQVDALAVESFEPSPDEAQVRGTVQAHVPTNPNAHTCDPLVGTCFGF